MTANDDTGLCQLIYRSRSALTGSDASIEIEMSSIIDRSRYNNLRDGVTGALMFTASVFVQVLEGRRADVERIFERICGDLRHMDVKLMSFSSVPAPTFGNWQMQRVHADATNEAMFRSLGEASIAPSSTADPISRIVALMAVLAATNP